jgi:Ca-activated chloride channel homolog
MTIRYPLMILVAAAACAGLALAYRALHRRRVAALAAAGLRAPATRRSRIRRHLPPALFLAALALLLLAVARPEATVKLPRAAGTIVLAFDVSTSMTATDVTPSRLAAAQRAATEFVAKQPPSVDVGVVAFDQGALTTSAPGKDHDKAIAAIGRLHAAGGTSLGQAILAALSAIVGRQVSLPDAEANGGAGATPPALGYWGSATIVLLSDGENTGGPDAVAAAELAAAAGVHVETVGFGTVEGTTVQADGYQMETALDEGLLTEIAQTTAGSYRRAADAAALDGIYRALDLRITAKPEALELTGVAVALAILLLTIGGLLMLAWTGRIL